MSFRADIQSKSPFLDFSIVSQQQGIIGLYGPSGSGKTSLLNILAGIKSPEQCNILFGNERVDLKQTHERSIFWVAQQPHLFPHWTVKQNLEFAASQKGHCIEVCEDLLQLLNCQGLLDRMPAGLSGGEIQRICLVRALSLASLHQDYGALLLLDEPFSALNKEYKETALRYIAQLRNKVLVFFVSHQFEDIARLADTCILIEDGYIKHKGTVAEVTSDAKNTLVKSFRYVLNNERFLIYANEVIVGLQELNHSSIRHTVSCEITSLHIYQGHMLLTGKDKSKQTILAEISNAAVDELGLKVGDTVYAFFKQTGLLKAFI